MLIQSFLIPSFFAGAPTSITGVSTLEGTAYVIFGGKHPQDLYISKMTASDGIIITSGAVGDFCGSTVSGAGGTCFVWCGVLVV